MNEHIFEKKESSLFFIATIFYHSSWTDDPAADNGQDCPLSTWEYDYIVINNVSVCSNTFTITLAHFKLNVIRFEQKIGVD